MKFLRVCTLLGQRSEPRPLTPAAVVRSRLRAVLEPTGGQTVISGKLTCTLDAKALQNTTSLKNTK